MTQTHPHSLTATHRPPAAPAAQNVSVPHRKSPDRGRKGRSRRNGTTATGSSPAPELHPYEKLLFAISRRLFEGFVRFRNGHRPASA